MAYKYSIYKPEIKRHYHFNCIVLILFSILLTHCGQNVVFPTFLTGTWITEAEQYEDRFIEISKDKLIFGTGDYIPTIYYIGRITQERVNNEDEYTFKCVNAEDTEFSFIFYFENNETGTLMRLKNPRQVVWIKETESP